MHAPIECTEECLRIIEQLSGPGLLIGLESPSGVRLVGCAPIPAGNSAAEAAEAVGGLLPHGVSVVGTASASDAQPPALPGSSVTASVSGGGGVTFSHRGGPSAGAQTADAAATPLHQPGYATVRCHADLRLHVETPPEGVTPVQQIAAAFKQAKAALLCDRTVFLASGRSEALREGLWQAQPSTTLRDALAAAAAAGVLEVTPFVAASSGTDPLPVAPVFEFSPSRAGGEASVSAVPLQLDVLAFVPLAAPLEALRSTLFAALGAQLAGMQTLLASQPALVPLRALHFAPRGLLHPVTLVVPLLGTSAEVCELKLRPTRQRAHEALGLPLNAPMLRFANALTFEDAEGGAGAGGGVAAGGRLWDVHATLPPPPIGGRVALVQGSYAYHHYMQDRTNDSGWGCAYRSLQTLCSWFRAQGYTAKPPPSHREVQATLARMGDKPPSFVGSSQWIGAIELSYVLDEYLGVVSKVITVNRGADIPSHARQLAAHFDAQGTPVMIGGGVLAYTLLGVAFDEMTGDAAFLILDPHYTGGEDLKKIHAGGWVAWKQVDDSAAAGGPLFVENAFYNFLCPQRPSEV